MTPALSYPSNTLWLSLSGASNGWVNLILNGTQPGSNYTLLSQPTLTASNWSAAGLVTGAQNQTWTAVQMPVNGSVWFVRAQYNAGGGSGGGTGGGTNGGTAADYGTNLWLSLTGVSNGIASLAVANSAQDILYEIQGKTNLLQTDWISYGFVNGSELTTWTPMSLFAGKQGNLFLRIRSWADSTGTGIPDWWWLTYFGQITNVDAYADPMQDGWSNLQKFQLGLSPTNFCTPPTPTGIYAYVDSTGTNVLLSWNPSPGPVQHYIIGRYDFNWDTWGWDFTALGQLNGNTTSFEDVGAINDGDYWDSYYQIQAVYASGSSPVATSWIYSSPPVPTFTYNIHITAQMVRNGNGRWQLVFSSIPSTVQTIAFYWYTFDYYYGYWGPDTTDLYNGMPFTTETDIPVSSLTNGIYVFPDFMMTNWFPNNAFGKMAIVQPIGANNQYGNLCQSGLQPYDSPVWVDGRQHMKQNMLYQLRSATISQPNAPLSEYNVWWDPFFENIGIPVDTNYVESSFFHWSLQFIGWGLNTANAYMKMDNLWPFTANYELHQNLYDPNYTGPSSFNWDPNPGDFYSGFNLSFQGSLAIVPAPAVLGIVDPYWTSQSLNNLADIAAYTDNGNFYLESGANNLFGLAFKDALVNQEGWDYWDDPPVYVPPLTIAPGGDTAITNVDCFYSQTVDPSLQLANYYFAPVNTPGTALPPFTSTAQTYPLPSYTGFANTNQTGIMITSVGTPTVIGGWAKFSIQNGNPNKFAYLGQYYITNAYMFDANGNLTTNTTDIVSPYGDFFPTQPGMVAMVTMPDIDTGAQGTGVVRVVSLCADANHDGILDTSYAGPDFTSPSRPLRFWVDDSSDDGDYGGTGIPGQGAQGNAMRQNGLHQYVIQGRRDLVNFFPVYLNIGSLFQSNALSAGISATDTNYQFILSQADGALRFAYTELTPANYMSFLQDFNWSGNLAYGSGGPDGVYAQLTTISNTGVVLSNSFVDGIATNNQGIILVEAWESTTQPLVLTIYHGTNQIAQTSLYLSISGVEQMFRHKNLMLNPDATAPADRLTDASVPNEPDTTENNFLFLHGYNVNSREARGVAADMFKRMYWSGSHAKFYAVTWSGADTKSFAYGAFTPNYHSNVFNAFNTAPLLNSFLNSLSGTNIVAAHSLGNMVTLSAISDWNAPISQYFMMDAAVAMEAIDSSATPTNVMIYSTWMAYSNRCFASDWWQLWPTNDARSTLAWNNKLGNLRNVDVYNFYSSGEEVLREYDGDTPDGVVDALWTKIIQKSWSSVPVASYVWVWQEKGKGTCHQDWLIGSTHGGWRFPVNEYGDPDPAPPATANTLSNSVLQVTPVFTFGSYFDSVVGPHPDLTLTNLATGSAYAAANRNRILSDAIPALSLPAGANQVPKFVPNDHNVDMMIFENNWPAGRPHTGSEANKWYHSDFHEVAYTFTYKLFDQFVTTGNLK